MKVSDLFKLIYISTANDNLTDQDLKDIEASAVRTNSQRGVTGFLLYNGLNFIQLLEGRENDVMTILEAIKNDKRHFGLIVIFSEPAQSRSFPEWSMQTARIQQNIKSVQDAARKNTLDPASLPATLEPHIANLFSGIHSLKGL